MAAAPALRPAPRRPAGSRPRPAPARKPLKRARPVEAVMKLQRSVLVDRLLTGRAWIVLVGALLVGIVFLNVALLELNAGIARTSEQVSTLKRENARLRLKAAKLGSSERIQRAASEIGLVLPAPGQVRYLKSRPAKDSTRALSRMRSPDTLATAPVTPTAAPVGALPPPVVPVPTPVQTAPQPTPAPVAQQPAPAAAPQAAVTPTTPAPTG